MEEYLAQFPQEVVEILMEPTDDDGDMYENCIRLQQKLEAIGWTCDFDLGGEVFDIKIKN